MSFSGSLFLFLHNIFPHLIPFFQYFLFPSFSFFLLRFQFYFLFLFTYLLIIFFYFIIYLGSLYNLLRVSRLILYQSLSLIKITRRFRLFVNLFVGTYWNFRRIFYNFRWAFSFLSLTVHFIMTRFRSILIFFFNLLL